MPKVSVIIPVYNVEQYLEKCLDSVINQTLKDIEIICINDCSPDNSLEILKKYASSDNRIKIIDFKENKGAAVARNEGIRQAKGEYIGFIDSDDWVDLDFYEKLYNVAKGNKSNLIIGNIAEIDNNGQRLEVYSLLREKIKQNKLAFNGNFVIGLYAKELLDEHSLCFIENVSFGEDRMLPLMAAYYSKNFKMLDDTFYNYYQRSNSASKTFGIEQIKDFCYTTGLVLDFAYDLNVSNNDKVSILDGFVIQALNLFSKSEEDEINYFKSLFKSFFDKFSSNIIEYYFLNSLDLNKENNEIKRQVKIIANKIICKDLRNRQKAVL